MTRFDDPRLLQTRIAAEFLNEGSQWLIGKAQALNSEAKKPAPISALEKKTFDLIDINVATIEQLKTFTGIGDAHAKKVIGASRYKIRTDLKSIKIIPAVTCDKIAGMIIAKHE